MRSLDRLYLSQFALTPPAIPLIPFGYALISEEMRRSRCSNQTRRG